MTIIPTIPIFQAELRLEPASFAAKAREEQTFYEDHCGLEFPGWIRHAMALLLSANIRAPRSRGA